MITKQSRAVFGRQVPVADVSVPTAWENFRTLLFPALISFVFLQLWFVLSIHYQPPPLLISIIVQSYNGYSNGYGGGGGGGYGGYGGGYDDRMSNLGGSLRAVDWNSTKLERFEKNFYVEDKRVSSRSEREIEDFRREKEIKVRSACQLTRSFRSYSIRSKVVAFPDLSLHSKKSDSRSIL